MKDLRLLILSCQLLGMRGQGRKSLIIKIHAELLAVYSLAFEPH